MPSLINTLFARCSWNRIDRRKCQSEEKNMMEMEWSYGIQKSYIKTPKGEPI